MPTEGSTILRDKPNSAFVDAIKRQVELPASEGQDTAGTGSPDALEPWPDETADYKAAGRNAAHPLETLFFLPKGRLTRGFAYSNLEEVFFRDSDKPGQGPVMVARFAGSRVTEVVIEGRGLNPICNDLGRRRCPWLWELPTGKDYREENAAVITKIDFTTVE